MDYKFKEKIKNDSITIAIIYKHNSYKQALSLKNKIESRYSNGLKSYKVIATLSPYSKIKNTDANIFYLLPAKTAEIKNCVKQANKTESITFAYDKKDLQYGVMMSLGVAKKIKVILNLDAIKKHRVSLRPTLLQISTIYKKTAGVQ